MSDHVDPGRARFEAFKTLDRDAPIQMLNLVRLRDKANYPGDHILARDGLSGAQAYRTYGRESGPVFARVGGKIVWGGGFDMTLIGPPDEVWDILFVTSYPTAHAFLEMLADPAYQAAVVHRQAAVATSRLIRCAPAPEKSGFA